jgi:hypothetical protein
MFGVTSKKRHIHFKVAVADFDEKTLLVICDGKALLVFQP